MSKPEDKLSPDELRQKMIDEDKEFYRKQRALGLKEKQRRQKEKQQRQEKEKQESKELWGNLAKLGKGLIALPGIMMRNFITLLPLLCFFAAGIALGEQVHGSWWYKWSVILAVWMIGSACTRFFRFETSLGKRLDRIDKALGISKPPDSDDNEAA